MEETNLDAMEVAANESVCPSCRLVYITAAGSWGVCSDCFAEGILALPS